MADLSDRVSYARSILVTVPLILIYTAVMGTISVACSVFDSHGRMQHGCSRLWSRLILWTSRVRLEVSGSENLEPNVPYVLCVNHLSHMDIPIVLVALPIQFRFAAKKELFGIPFLGWHLRRSGHVSIDRGNPRAAVRSLVKAAESIRAGTSVVIFPEGGTSFDGEIQPFKGGGFMLATRSHAKVVPVTIRGSREILLPKTRHVRAGKVEVIIGKPISSDDLSSSELATLTHDQIVATFYGAGRL